MECLVQAITASDPWDAQTNRTSTFMLGNRTHETSITLRDHPTKGKAMFCNYDLHPSSILYAERRPI